MSDSVEKTGGCLCGAVRFTATAANSVGACSCNMCTKWNGGPQMAVPCGENVTFENDDNIAEFKSSEWAERGFCKICGSHLFFRFHGSHHMMMAGAFDDAEGFEFNRQYFIDQKPHYYDFGNDTENLTADQVTEMMGLK